MSLHVTELQIKDFKKIEALRIDIETGKPLVLSGTNAAGKSSIIDSLFFALSGNGAERPIRTGATKARVTLKIEGKDTAFEIERVVTASGGASLKVTDAEGKQVPKAQTFLNGIFSQHAIDPLGFLKMKPKEQAEALKRITGLTAQIGEIEAREATEMDRRKTVNAMVKALENQLDGVPAPKGSFPDQEVDVAALAAEIDAITVIQHEFDVKKRWMDSKIQERDRLESEVNALQVEIDRKREAMHANQREMQSRADLLEAARRAAVEANAKADTIRADIANAKVTNEGVRVKNKRKELGTLLMAETKKADAMTTEIERLRQQKLDLIQNAKLPIEGLALSDDGLIFKGTPLGDLNTAEQIRVCCAIAMAEKPELRIIQVKEAALVSPANFKALCEIAAEQGFDVVAEHYSETPIEGALHIVDGEISA